MINIQKNEPTVIFNAKAFSDRLSDDSALMREVVNVFLKETSKNIRTLENTIKKQRKDEAARLAHNIRGGAANVSANQFLAVAVKLEMACRAGDWREAEDLLPELNRQFEILEQAVRKFQKTLS